jgi:hypothetical protein
MLMLRDRDSSVEVKCPACETRQAFPRFISRLPDGSVRHEPEPGQWLPCHVCGDWSPLDGRREAPTPAGSGRP